MQLPKVASFCQKCGRSYRQRGTLKVFCPTCRGEAIPQHLSETDSHFTPSYIVEPARNLLGGIDLDPASCAEANERIQAREYYDREGLDRPWYGRVFLNPPGGKVLRGPGGRWVPMTVKRGRGHSSQLVWWTLLSERWAKGEVVSAFFISFNLEIQRLAQTTPWPVQRFARCYPRKRIQFSGKSPAHPNMLVYLPPKGEEARSGEILREHFGSLGFCEGPCLL